MCTLLVPIPTPKVPDPCAVKVVLVGTEEADGEVFGFDSIGASWERSAFGVGNGHVLGTAFAPIAPKFKVDKVSFAELQIVSGVDKLSRGIFEPLLVLGYGLRWLDFGGIPADRLLKF